MNYDTDIFTNKTLSATPLKTIDVSKIADHLRIIHKEVVANINTPELKALVKDKTYIAGGALRSMFEGTKINDYDLFFRDRDSAMKFVKLISKGLNGKLQASPLAQAIGNDQEFTSKNLRASGIKIFNEYDSIKKAVSMDEILAITKNALTFRMKSSVGLVTIQFIINYSGVPKRLVKRFDFTNSMAYYDPIADYIDFPYQTKDAITNKRLEFNDNPFSPLDTLARIDKFTKMGYHIKWKDLKELTLQIIENHTSEEIAEYKGRGAY